MTTWNIVGHDWAVRQLQVALDHGEMPQALLISGPENVGKTTLARIVSNALLCQGPADQHPCGVCRACRKFASGNHPDFMRVEAEEQGGSLKIDQIRAVERFLALTPNESAHKIALINTFERATSGAANALLKTLEEPPAYAHLILLAQDADLVLPTIVSRSQQIVLRPLSPVTIAEALHTRWHVPEEQAGHLARISGGRMGWAIRAATEAEYSRRMDNALTLLFGLLRQDLPSRFDAVQTLVRDENIPLEETLAYWLTAWRDVVLIQTGNEPEITHQEFYDTLMQIARHVPLADAIHTL